MVRVIDHARVDDQAIKFAKLKLCTREQFQPYLNGFVGNELYIHTYVTSS